LADLARSEVELGESRARSRKRDDLACDGPPSRALQDTDAWMRLVFGAVYGERLRGPVGLVGFGDVQDGDRPVADEEAEPAGRGRIFRAEHDRDRERGSVGEPATGHDRLVVLATYECVDRCERPRGEHENGGELP